MKRCMVCLKTHDKHAECPGPVTVAGLEERQPANPKKIHLQGPQISERDAVAYLVEALNGKLCPITFPECTVGRDPKCDVVVVGEDSVSRMHFVISHRQGKFYLTDSASSNGTFLNGAMITGQVSLADEDRIRAGRFGLQFMISKGFKERGRVSPAILNHLKSTSQPAGQSEALETLDLILTKTQRSGLELAVAAAAAAIPVSAPAAKPAASSQPAESLPLLEEELAELQAREAEIQRKIRACQARIQAAKLPAPQKVPPLIDKVLDNCLVILRSLGWEVRSQDGPEFLLQFESDPPVLLRIVAANASTAASELGKLHHSQELLLKSQSVAASAILVLHFTEEVIASDLPASLLSASEQKGICLLTTEHLYATYQAISNNPLAVPAIRDALLASAGIPKFLQ